jgi:hypothetical protein
LGFLAEEAADGGTRDVGLEGAVVCVGDDVGDACRLISSAVMTRLYGFRPQLATTASTMHSMLHR